jgi:hypothetical protein
MPLLLACAWGGGVDRGCKCRGLSGAEERVQKAMDAPIIMAHKCHSFTTLIFSGTHCGTLCV